MSYYILGEKFNFGSCTDDTNLRPPYLPVDLYRMACAILSVFIKTDTFGCKKRTQFRDQYIGGKTDQRLVYKISRSCVTKIF
jgi:hypothetical protein